MNNIIVENDLIFQNNNNIIINNKLILNKSIMSNSLNSNIIINKLAIFNNEEKNKKLIYLLLSDKKVIKKMENSFQLPFLQNIKITPLTIDTNFSEIEENMEEIRYKKNNNILEKLKMDDIKIILDYYIKTYKYFKYYTNAFKIKLNKSGNKKELTQHIKLWYFLNIMIEKIQKIIRGSIIRKWIKLRGPALMNRKICVNETDFCTLEPLIDINDKHFFSYKDDESGCIFGFDICSLWTMYKKKGITITNPSLKRLSIEKSNTYNKKILKENQENIKQNNYILTNNIIRDPYNRNQINNDSKIYKNAIELYFIISLLKNNEYNYDSSIINQDNYTLIEFPLNMTNINNFSNQPILLLSLQTKMIEIRNKSLNNRINEAFIEIGYLDFYISVNWFINLNKSECYVFLQRLKHIWDYGFRNNFNQYQPILNDTKKKICFLHDPFYNIDCNFNEIEKSLNEIQLLSIYVIENLIYLGIDFDNKRLGAMYVLTALTTVSTDARSTLDWLYENFNI